MPPENSRPSRQSSLGGEARLKVVVRSLPPNLPEAIFWQSVEPWVTEETTLWKSFCPGKFRKALNKENVPSRAYIAFKTADKLAEFNRGYDGHLFRDKAGNESEAVVEFAAFQKVPPEKKKNDPRAGTILEDDDYTSFIASLQQTQPTEAERQAQAASIANAASEGANITTPLLAALLAEKNAKETTHHRTTSHFERLQRERAEEVLEFRRNPLPPPPTPTTVKIAERPTQAQARSRTPTQSTSSKPGPPATPDGPSASGSTKKGRGAQRAPPTPPARPPKRKPSVASSSTGAAGQAQPPKSRPPKPKFDVVLAALPKGNAPTPNNNPPATISQLSSSDPARRDAVIRTDGGGAPPLVSNEPGAGQSKRAKQRAKAREREKERKDADGTDVSEASPAVSSGPSSNSMPTPEPTAPVPPKILLRPVARIDDNDASSASTPSAGIIPIQLAFPGRGARGGRRGGRGGGSGRGHKDTSPTTK
ncbi:hypothetical protein FRB98_001497 [Tulasnella sp. 332]|nr:hypothetical protein FRB98_001497 [Tulasnella sp. 332]